MIYFIRNGAFYNMNADGTDPVEVVPAAQFGAVHMDVRWSWGVAPFVVVNQRRVPLVGTAAMRWIISFFRDRTEKTMAERLAAELILASKGEGNTIKKKEDTHRMAEANRAYAHYRW